MKRFLTLLPGMAALAALCLAHTANAAPVGSLACAEVNGNEFTFNVSYFTFGVADTINISTGTGGGGGGKATFQPLEVHAALSTFAMLEIPAADGARFRSCTLTTALSDGTTTTFLFRPVVIKSLTAVAEKRATSETPAQYTDVQFEYLQVEVKTSGGADDGGTSPDSSGSTRIIISSEPGAIRPD